MALVFPSSMPYDEINVIDQSSYSDAPNVVETPFIPSGPTAFVPFISPRGYGNDNKLQYMSEAVLSKYGTPNLKKYGLSLYLAKQFIAGGGTLLGMRVTTDDMTHANAVITAKLVTTDTCVDYTVATNAITNETVLRPKFIRNDETVIYDELEIKDPKDINTITIKQINDRGIETDVFVKDLDKLSLNINGTIVDLDVSISGNTLTLSDDDNGVITSKSLNTATLTYEVSSIAGNNTRSISNVEDVIAAANSLYNADQAGVTMAYPIAVICATGAGKYGNEFKFRVTPDVSTNNALKDTESTGFCYKFIDSDGPRSLDNTFTFSFDDECVYNNESMCIDDVFDMYSPYITMKKLDAYDEFVEKLAELDVDVVGKDILFGTNLTGLYIDTIGGADLSVAVGHSLKNGADPAGTFSFSNDIFASVLAKAYNGEIDDLIYDQVRYPYQYIFCPSVDPRVTGAVHDLVTNNRKGTRASYFTCGTSTDVPKTYEDARIAAEAIPADSWKEDVVCEWARKTDGYTGKKTYFPSVYWNAYEFPYHWINRKGAALAGPSHATWTGFDIGTVAPRSSQPAQYIANHNAQLNTMIEDGIGKAVLYEQITAQPTASALSEINNAQILADMIRIALKIASDTRWTDIGDSEVETYKESVEYAISMNLRNCYDTMDIVVNRASSNGAGANRLYCRLNVKFKNILKGVSYDFYILAN